MRINKSVRFFLLSWCWIFVQLLSAQNQGVFPVAAVGNAITAPYSLLLSEYGTIRANNISFTVTLNDPIEVSRDVYFRIVIKSNGQEIRRSKPNFRGTTPVTLTQFTPTFLSGFELADYFKPENLTGGRGQNGSNLLPEGFTQICLEVIDLQREVPISNQACLGAFFQLFDPPFLELPACHGEILMPVRGASTLFKWLPRHLGLPGAPNLVDYELEIVELTRGIGNPNDAFNRSWTLGRRNTMGNSFLWMETDPPLEVGKKYAWRVRAIDLTGSQGVFKNQGFSEVCTFEVKRKVVPRYRITECHPANTEYPLAPEYGPESTNLQVDETIFVGYYDLKVKEAYYTGLGYDLKGEIYIPYLYCWVPVTGTSVQLNADNYVYGVGSLEVDQDPYYRQALERIHFVSWLKQNGGRRNGVARQMPISLDHRIRRNSTLAADVLLYDLNFTPRNSYVSAQAKLDGMLVFDKLDIPMAPSGPQQGNELILSTTNTDFLNALDPHLHLIYEQSQIEWDCKGAKEFEMKAYYEFEAEQGRPKAEVVAGPGIPINGKAKALISLPTPTATDFIVKVDEMDELLMKDPLPLIVTPNNVAFDFSLKDSVRLMEYPAHYVGREDTSWRGFVYQSGTIQLPDEWDLTGTGKPFTMAKKAFIIDSLATYGIHREQRRILSLNTGKVGKWRLQVDGLRLVVDETLVDTFDFKGRTGPEVSQPTVPYTGTWTNTPIAGQVINQSPPYYYLDISDTLKLPLWRGYLALDSVRSHIIAQPSYDYNTGVTSLGGFPDLFGNLNILPRMRDVDANPFNKPAVDSLQIKSAPLGNHHISTKNLYVEHFKIDHPDNPNGRPFYAQTYNAGSTFNIGSADLTMDIMVLPEKDSIEVNGRYYHAKIFHISDENYPMQVKVYGIDPNRDGFYTFGKVELIPEALLGPDQPFICDCNPSPPAVICAPELPTDFTPGTTNIGDVIDLGGFKMIIENPGFAKLRVGFLKQNINVTTSGLSANIDGVALSGTATSIYDNGLTGGQSDLLQVDFTESLINGLLANDEGLSMPIPAGEQIIESAADIGETIDVPKEFFLTWMQFRTDGATSEGILARPLSNGKNLIFKSNRFETRINGFNFPTIPFALLKTVTL